MKRLIISLAALLFVALIAIFVAVHSMGLPPGGEGEAQIIVKPGQSLKQVAQSLEQAGVIRSSVYFVWFVRSRDSAKSIRAGEYMIPKSLYPVDVLDRLTHGRVLFRQFTVPEGKTLAEIARIVEKEGIVSSAAFIEAALNTAGMENYIAPDARNLEGVLFPETYTYTRDVKASDLVKMMTGRFRVVFEPLWKDKDPALTMKPYETIILAGIIEKETGRADERPLIAGVFLNRLNRKMRLMSDPTVIYGLSNYSGKLTKADLERPTPYNTYARDGLPVGPICNPGAESLKAALRPLKTDALYFVAKGDGTHQFSNTLEEHNQAVQRYQRGIQ